LINRQDLRFKNKDLGLQDKDLGPEDKDKNLYIGPEGEGLSSRTTNALGYSEEWLY